MANLLIQNQLLSNTISPWSQCGFSCAQYYLVFLLSLIIYSIPSFSYSASQNTGSSKTDLRILIDVSGSMKENDPQNLRASSVRLLVGLIPEGTKAGIWTFGQYVNMQVKHGKVTRSWKKLARTEAGNIHSRGLFTNIEAVLRKSSFDWKIKDPSTNRHIILLTDGVVDISKNPDVNLKSRNKIIEKYLPRLKKAGVKIHTIALSQQADHTLLKKLSVTTDGWYELVEDPNKLQRVFLRLFEKSTSANTLPLEGNIFKVDKSITDMTILSFTGNSLKTKLITPAKKTITKDSKIKSVTWFHEDGYDLITISKPEAGDWKLDAPVDKDNRVIVVTNLTLSINEIPNNVLLNQKIVIKAELKQKNKNIRNKKFLKLVKMKAIKIVASEPEMAIELYDNGKNLDNKINDGIYYNSIRSPLRAGVFEIVVKAEGPTFLRQRQYSVNVFNGLADIEIKSGKNKEPFLIEVKPHKGLLQDGSIDISYELDNGKTKKIIKGKDGFWKIGITEKEAGKKISFTVKGIRQNNKSVEMQMERVLPERIDKIKKLLTDTKNKTTRINKKELTKKQAEETGGWASISIWVLSINLLLILISGILYFVIKKIRAKKLIKEKEDLKL